MKCKLYSFIGLILQLCHFILLIFSCFDYGYSGEGMGLGFQLWFYSLIPAFLCVFFYLASAIIDNMEKRTKASLAMLAFSISAIVLLFSIGVSGNIYHIIIWNIFFAALFVAELFFVKNKKSCYTEEK